jgi:hypothetical protein
LTLKEAIKTLSPTIRKLLRRRYSRAKVVELLREQGVPVSLSTLKQYFREKATEVSAPEVHGPVSKSVNVAAAEGKAPTALRAKPASDPATVQRRSSGTPAPGREPLVSKGTA